MRTRQLGLAGIALIISLGAVAQVDTSYVYKTNTPYGTLDIRIRKSSTRYYYLQENRTFAYRASNGVRTYKYMDMTSWDSSPYTQGNMREKNGTADYFIMNYRLLFPNNYNATYNPGYPLIVMMHGAGERGNCWMSTCYHADKTWNPNTNNPAAPTDVSSKLLNNDHNLLHGGKPHLDARNLAGSRLPNDPSMPGRAFPGFVLFPQSLNGWDTNESQDMIKLVRLISKKYNIDEDRIYIHGLSNGGAGVYQVVKRAPWLFAAALPMSASGDNGLITQKQTSAVAHIPFWTFQGGQDRAPSPALTEKYVRALRDAGAIVRYTLYANIGHSTWNSAFKEPDFFKWILSKNKANIHTFGGGTAICLTNGQGVRMELAAGFRKYQWEKNGVIISGATTATYTATTTGTYRARFSRVANPTSSDWNQWSAPITVTQQNPPQARIEQQGTVLLKDLNGYGNAHLKAEGEYAHYYWYKNGALINLSGDRDDTTQFAIFKQGTCTGTCSGNGTYTLITAGADNCPTPRSAPKQIFFNNQAPINIAAPTNFTGRAVSSTSVSLTWSDPSTNEGGFEIWRRKANGTTYSKWEMRTLTGANVKTFTDNGAAPSTTYHYKIRAVSSAGRSNYTPSASNAFLVITTSGDNTLPSTPQSLTASTVAINTVKLTWKPSTDNTGIKQYRIYYAGKTVATNSSTPSFTISNLTLNTNYTFTVKAEDLGGNLSGLSNSASANTTVTGLYYEHTTGAWSDLDAINWTGVPEHIGKVTTFTLAPRVQEDYFNFEFDGYLYIRQSGSYQFRTVSSDGSRVILNGAVVVENDGIHDSRSISGPLQNLSSGAKRITARYFEYDGTHVLTVQYKGPDTNNAWITIPASALTSNGSSTTSTMMARTSTDSAQVVDSVGMVDAIEADVYPNPSTVDNINVRMSKVQAPQVRISLLDFTGKEIFRDVYEVDVFNPEVRLNMTTPLDNGFYILVIEHAGKIIQRRISIQQ